MAQLTPADSLVQSGNYQEGIEMYKSESESEFKMARVYAQIGDVYAALDSYQKVLNETVLVCNHDLNMRVSHWVITIL